MRIPLNKLHPNPFRDFELYPIEEDQVQKLMQSIGELGFFSGITVRPIGSGQYQIAAGHHRFKAQERLAALPENLANPEMQIVEAVSDTYTDEEMVRIMCVENATQRGNTQASINDSVAAHSRLVVKDVLLGDGPCTKILVDVDPGLLLRTQNAIVQDGPGIELLYRSINGFAKKDRKANKEQEILTETEIQRALSTLKSSGYMAKIVGLVYAEVEAVRAEKDRKAREAADKAERQRLREAAAEERRILAEQEDLKRKHEAAEAAEKRAADAKAAAAENAKKKEEARLAQVEADKARAAEAEAKRVADASAAAAKKAKDEADAKAKADADARKKIEDARKAEHDAVEALKHRPVDFDQRCDQLFPKASQAVAFREAVLGPYGRQVLPMDKQYEFAQAILDELADHAKATRRPLDELGGVVVQSSIQRKFDELSRRVRDEEKNAERLRLERMGRQDRVKHYWAELKNNIGKTLSTMEALRDRQANWQSGDGPFPIDMGVVSDCNILAQGMIALAKNMGLDPDHRTQTDGQYEQRLKIAGLLR